MSSLWKKILTPVVELYRRDVGAHMRNYGLNIDDFQNVYWHTNTARALELIPEEERMNRIRRILRAQDLDIKHEHLSEELQATQDTFRHYLQPTRDRLTERDFGINNTR